jgi:hypothetical protein
MSGVPVSRRSGGLHAELPEAHLAVSLFIRRSSAAGPCRIGRSVHRPPEPMIAAADGDASTVVTPAEEPSLASGAGGYGTLAV